MMTNLTFLPRRIRELFTLSPASLERVADIPAVREIIDHVHEEGRAEREHLLDVLVRAEQDHAAERPALVAAVDAAAAHDAEARAAARDAWIALAVTKGALAESDAALERTRRRTEASLSGLGEREVLELIEALELEQRQLSALLPAHPSSLGGHASRVAAALAEAQELRLARTSPAALRERVAEIRAAGVIGHAMAHAGRRPSGE